MLFACLCVSEREEESESARKKKATRAKLVKVLPVTHQPGSKSRSTELVSWLTKVINPPTL